MSLTITGIPDCRASLGPSQDLKAYQLQPGTADYPSGGYPILLSPVSGAQISIAALYGAWIIGGNSAAASYDPHFVFPAAVFGTNPGPALGAASQTVYMKILQPPTGNQSAITTGTSATTTNSALTTNVATITVPNTFVPGQFVVVQGLANGAMNLLNGLIAQVITATAALFTCNFTHANVGTAGDAAGTVSPLQGPNGIVTGGATVTSTNSVLTSKVATITAPNTFQAGQFVVLQGFTNALATAFNGQVVQIKTANATTFTFSFNHADIVTGADVGTAQLLVSGGTPVTSGAAFSITNSVLTSNVVSLTAANNLIAGQFVVAQGLTNGANLNGTVLNVISTGLTAALFEANLTLTNISTGADIGLAYPMVANGLVEVPAGTDLSGCTWFAEMLGY